MSAYVQWCNENEQRDYPLKAETTRTSDAGALLPPGILVDLGMIIPRTYDDAYISAVRVTDRIISIAIASQLAPLFTVTVDRTTYRPYTAVPMTAHTEDVSGWAVFGTYVPAAPEIYLFDSAAQSGIENRAMRIVDQIPVRRLLKLDGSVDAFVDNLVRIAGGLGLTVRQTAPDTVALILDSGKSLSFLGPCNQYADAGDCGAPIRRIRNVPPDENGRITLRLVPKDWEAP